MSSGGLGREITPLLRAASLPGSELVLPLLVNERVLGAGRAVGRLLGRVGLRVHTDLGEVLRGHASLSDGEARAAFLHTLRTIVDPWGQRVDASDRLYLAQAIPFLLVWGERDPIIPVEHARAAHRLVPGQPARALSRRRPLPAPRRPAALRPAADRLHGDDRAGAGRCRPLGRAAAQRRRARAGAWLSRRRRRQDARAVALAEELGAQLGRLKGAGPKITQFLSMVQLDRPGDAARARRAARRRAGGPLRPRANA